MKQEECHNKVLWHNMPVAYFAHRPPLLLSTSAQDALPSLSSKKMRKENSDCHRPAVTLPMRHQRITSNRGPYVLDKWELHPFSVSLSVKLPNQKMLHRAYAGICTGRCVHANLHKSTVPNTYGYTQVSRQVNFLLFRRLKTSRSTSKRKRLAKEVFWHFGMLNMVGN